MQGSSREAAHSWGIVGIQLENHREQGANSRDSERQQQGRRGLLPWGPPRCNWPNDSWPGGAQRTPAISTCNQHIVIHQRSYAIAFFIPFRQ